MPPRRPHAGETGQRQEREAVRSPDRQGNSMTYAPSVSSTSTGAGHAARSSGNDGHWKPPNVWSSRRRIRSVSCSSSHSSGQRQRSSCSGRLSDMGSSCLGDGDRRSGRRSSFAMHRSLAARARPPPTSAPAPTRTRSAPPDLLASTPTEPVEPASRAGQIGAKASGALLAARFRCSIGRRASGHLRARAGLRPTRSGGCTGTRDRVFNALTLISVPVDVPAHSRG
jgi:hypothetical protein